jgi:hypothetical protein
MVAANRPTAAGLRAEKEVKIAGDRREEKAAPSVEDRRTATAPPTAPAGASRQTDQSRRTTSNP